MIHIIICNYNAEKHLSNCLNSLRKQNLKNISISIHDNNSKDNSKNIIDINKDLFIHINYSDNNIGKALALNNLVTNLEGKKLIDENDLIFSLDSDISLLSDNFFEKVEYIYNILQNHISCIVCKQAGNSLFRRQINFIDSNKGFSYFVPQEGYGNGIAGGALIIPFKNWKIIKGYKINLGPNSNSALYGGVDGNALYDLYKNTNKPICVIKDLEVYHPPEENKKYQEWKDKQHSELLKYGHTLSLEEFYK